MVTLILLFLIASSVVYRVANIGVDICFRKAKDD